MHHAKNYTNKISPLEKCCRAPERPRAIYWTHWRTPPSTRPKTRGDSSSGSNDPIRDLEVQVNHLQTELRHRTGIWVADGDRINELRSDICRLQDQLGDRDLALDWAVNSRSLTWAKEAKARARVEELSSAVDNLQVYCNTLHEEVHVLYSQLHPNVPADPVGMEAGPS
jgi:hypothetical protein